MDIISNLRQEVATTSQWFVVPRVASAMSALLVFAVLAACSADDSSQPTAAGRADPVTVTGRVIQLRGEYAFEIGRMDGPPLLVVSARRPPALRPGAVVEATGKVRSLQVGRLGTELGVPLTGLESLEGTDCLVASAVMLAGGAQRQLPRARSSGPPRNSTLASSSPPDSGAAWSTNVKQAPPPA